MKNFYINLDEVYNILDDNVEELSRELKRELSYVCDLSNDDEYYAFADLIRSKKSNINWSLMRDQHDEVIMILSQPNKELKTKVFNILCNKNIIHSDISINGLVTIE